MGGWSRRPLRSSIVGPSGVPASDGGPRPRPRRPPRSGRSSVRTLAHTPGIPANTRRRTARLFAVSGAAGAARGAGGHPRSGLGPGDGSSLSARPPRGSAATRWRCHGDEGGNMTDQTFEFDVFAISSRKRTSSANSPRTRNVPRGVRGVPRRGAEGVSGRARAARPQPALPPRVPVDAQQGVRIPLPRAVRAAEGHRPAARPAAARGGDRAHNLRREAGPRAGASRREARLGPHSRASSTEHKLGPLSLLLSLGLRRALPSPLRLAVQSRARKATGPGRRAPVRRAGPAAPAGEARGIRTGGRRRRTRATPGSSEPSSTRPGSCRAAFCASGSAAGDARSAA